MAKKRKVNLGAQLITDVHEQPDGKVHLEINMDLWNKHQANKEFVAYKEMKKLVDAGFLPNDRASKAYLDGIRKKIIARGDDPDAEYEVTTDQG